MKKYAMPLWWLGALVTVGGAVATLTTKPVLAEKLKITEDQVQSGLFIFIGVIAVLSLFLLILGYMGRNSIPMRIVATLAALASIFVALQANPSFNGVAFDENHRRIAIVGQVIVALASLMLWAPAADKNELEEVQ